MQFTTWMQNTTMSYGHSYSNYTEDARKLLTGGSKFITLTPIPRKFIPESLFQWNVSPGTEGLSPTLGNKDGYGSKGAQGFHLPKSLKCKLAGVGWRREACRQRPPQPGATALTSIGCPHLHVHQVCFLVQSGHWPGEERRVRSSVTTRTADNKVGRHSGLVLRKLLSEGGLSSPWGPTKHGDSRALQSGCLWQLPPVMVTTQVSWSTARESAALKNIETKRAQNNVPHSKAGLNLCHWPSTISHLIISITSFLPEVLYSMSLSSPWGKWLNLPSGCLLPDTPALLSLDLSTFPYLYLVNNKYLVTNIQYLVWQFWW